MKFPQKMRLETNKQESANFTLTLPIEDDLDSFFVRFYYAQIIVFSQSLQTYY
ncbi:hypothetical protein [Crocosphaera sp. XPORK-15E]|uniref:hypothetical protein n=1 Tax=Crocosphaera sp. XPORK-15E TaxID=3110247 RepID=UPI002B1F7F72|nr:hypothetical protein [Crocosphaera sp. XPORK-15E]MEA5533223.1 hypothetical protein [Crocosphaera sp. XPORK-15E]